MRIIRSYHIISKKVHVDNDDNDENDENDKIMNHESCESTSVDSDEIMNHE